MQSVLTTPIVSEAASGFDETKVVNVAIIAPRDEARHKTMIISSAPPTDSDHHSWTHSGKKSVSLMFHACHFGRNGVPLHAVLLDIPLGFFRTEQIHNHRQATAVSPPTAITSGRDLKIKSNDSSGWQVPAL